MYDLKTAIIVREEDKQDLISFFKSIKPDCNKKYYWTKSFVKDLPINRVVYIDEYGHLDGWNLENFKKGYPDYTILNGIPKNWREEMNKPETDLQSKINQLENENNELRECLELCVIELESSYRKLGYSSSNILTQAKQLLK